MLVGLKEGLRLIGLKGCIGFIEFIVYRVYRAYRVRSALRIWYE